METGILGTPRRLELDVASAEAKAAIDTAADRVRALRDELRDAYERTLAAEAKTGSAMDMDLSGPPDAFDLTAARALIERLDLARRELSDAAATVASAGEAGSMGDRRQGPADDPATARAVLAGQEQERARLAEELHDGPAQALANVIFQAEIVARTIGANDAARAELGALRELVQRELDSLRGYVNQLRPSLHEERGLEEALRESAAHLAERTGIPVDVRIDAGAERLDEASRAVALRVAQEALRNVGKHASARRAWVRTSRSESTDQRSAAWVLEVGDDGQGFDADDAQAQADRRHFGLRFMRERAQLLGARLDIDTRPAVGTVVRLSISTEGRGETDGQ